MWKTTLIDNRRCSTFTSRSPSRSARPSPVTGSQPADYFSREFRVLQRRWPRVLPGSALFCDQVPVTR